MATLAMPRSFGPKLKQAAGYGAAGYAHLYSGRWPNEAMKSTSTNGHLSANGDRTCGSSETAICGNEVDVLIAKGVVYVIGGRNCGRSEIFTCGGEVNIGRGQLSGTGDRTCGSSEAITCGNEADIRVARGVADANGNRTMEILDLTLAAMKSTPA